MITTPAFINADQRIARTAALTTCRYCSGLITPDEVICHCRVARGELPHTEWSADLKRYLCTRTLERRMLPGTTMEAFWERMAIGLYAGTTQGAGKARVILPMAISVIDCLPYAAGDSSLWAASGYPSIFGIGGFR